MAKEEKDKTKKETIGESEEVETGENLVEEEKEAEAEGKEQDYNSIFDDDYDPDSDESSETEESEDEADEDNPEEVDNTKEADGEGEAQTKEKSKESSSKKSSNDKKKDTSGKKEKTKDTEEKPEDDDGEIILDNHRNKGEKDKGSLVKKVLISLAIILALLAGAFGGYLYFKSTDKPKEEPTPVKTEESKEEKAKKEVYVTADGGLNLRENPDSSSKSLTLIPSGTKLEVLDEQGDWYKVKYDGKEGWIWKSYTSDKNPLIYKNDEYGFQLTFLEDWSNYKVVKKDVDNGDGTTAPVLYVGIKVSDANYDSTVGKGYADMFAISVLTPDRWTAIEAGEGQKPTYITKSSKYVFTWSGSQAGPDEVLDERKKAQDIIDTFKLL